MVLSGKQTGTISECLFSHDGQCAARCCAVCPFPCAVLLCCILFDFSCHHHCTNSLFRLPPLRVTFLSFGLHSDKHSQWNMQIGPFVVCCSPTCNVISMSHYDPHCHCLLTVHRSSWHCALLCGGVDLESEGFGNSSGGWTSQSAATNVCKVDGCSNLVQVKRRITLRCTVRGQRLTQGWVGTECTGSEGSQTCQMRHVVQCVQLCDSNSSNSSPTAVAQGLQTRAPSHRPRSFHLALHKVSLSLSQFRRLQSDVRERARSRAKEGREGERESHAVSDKFKRVQQEQWMRAKTEFSGLQKVVQQWKAALRAVPLNWGTTFSSAIRLSLPDHMAPQTRRKRMWMWMERWWGGREIAVWPSLPRRCSRARLFSFSFSSLVQTSSSFSASFSSDTHQPGP